MATNKGGRPLKFKTVKDLQEKIDAYFADCDPHPEEVTTFKWNKVEEEYKDVNGKNRTRKIEDRTLPPVELTEWRITDQQPYTITGLANFLETSRETLINYEKREEFFDTIKAAKGKIEQYWENQLLGAHATGPIFNLKNNYGWVDQSQLDSNVNLGVDISAEQAEQLIKARTRRSDS
jgi:hypothetical protein